MKLSIVKNGDDVSRRIWRALDPTVRFALLGLGLVRIGDDGRPMLDELPGRTLQEVERACGVRA